MKHLGEIGRYMFLAIVCFELAYVRCFLLPNTVIKASCLLVVSICVYLTITHDQGASFEHHGEFNLVAFLALFTIVSIVVTSVYIIRKYRIWKPFLVAVIVLMIWTKVSLNNVSGNFGKGIMGGKMTFDNEGCSIPRVTPWVELLPRRYLNFFTGSEQCDTTGFKRFAKIEEGVLTIDCPKGTAYYIVNPNFVEREEFIEYHNGEKLESTDLRRLWKNLEYKDVKRNYEGPVKIREGENVRAFCDNHENYFVLNVLQTKTKERAEARHSPRKAKEDPNVLMVVIDSLSRAHFNRRMHKTISWLEKADSSNGGHFEVFEFFKHHAVECCTPGNMRPLLAGKTKEEVDVVTDHIGDYFLWKNFTDAGYVSLYLNDLCQDFFRMYFYQNSSQFVDHECVLPFCHYDYSRATNGFSNFKGGPYSIEKRCIGDSYVHTYAMTYVTQYFQNYRAVPKFGVVLFAESHESSGAVISTMDADMAKFLDKTLTDHPNTIVLLIADHGLHMGPYAVSPAGKVEQMMPLLITVWPTQFTNKHPEVKEALKHNQQSLTTHFDVYKTLHHVINYPEMTEAQFPDDSTYKQSAKSLLEKIPYTRTCEQAAIPDNFCVCTNNK